MITTAKAEVARQQRIDWTLIGMVLTVKMLILLYGVVSYQIVTDRPLPSVQAALAIWNHWDGPHYLDLARYGYQPEGEIRLFLVFYPLYPLLVRLFENLTGDYLLAAFVVSAFASVAAGLLLERLARFDQPADVARRAVWFLLIFPTSYFLHIGFTEGLFLALALGCFVAARSERWPLAGILGALAALARVNGIMLVPALAMEAYLIYRRTRRWDWQWLWIAGVGAGTGGYLLLNYTVTGNPLAFAEIQREHWYKSLAWPWTGIRALVESLSYRGPSKSQMYVGQELLFLGIGIVCTVLTWTKLRPSYGVWMAGNVLLFASTSFILSTPRYVLILFPMYILFARLGESRAWYTVLTVWSLLLMSFFIGQFVQGRWAF